MSDPLKLHSSPEDIGLSLDSDLVETPSPETDVALPDHTLLAQARQGNLTALCQFFNTELLGSGIEVTEVIARGRLLQMSLAGEQVPTEQQVVPRIRASTKQLGEIPFETIELYGERYGSELPYWRVGFKVGEPETVEEVLDIEPLPSPSSMDASSPPDASPLDVEPHSDLAADPWPLDAEILPLANDGSLVSAPIPEPRALTVPLEATPVVVHGEEPSEGVEITNLPGQRAISPERQQVTQTFLDRYTAGDRDFAAIDLSETDLSGVNLTLADLRQAQLIWTNLQGAALYHVNLSSAKLRYANLKNAKLRSANLKGADFLNADLSGADLSWSNLSGANLTGANLTDANLNNAIISCVVMPDGTLLD